MQTSIQHEATEHLSTCTQIDPTVGEIVRAIRLGSGAEVKAVARAWGIKPKHLRAIESGEVAMTEAEALEFAATIAERLHSPRPIAEAYSLGFDRGQRKGREAAS